MILEPGRYVVVDFTPDPAAGPFQWGHVVDAGEPSWEPDPTDPAPTGRDGKPSRMKRVATWIVKVAKPEPSDRGDGTYPFPEARLTVMSNAEIRATGEAGKLR